MAKPSKQTVTQLAAIIERLEKWQWKNDSQHDPTGHSRAAKDHLMRLLADLERSRGE